MAAPRARIGAETARLEATKLKPPVHIPFGFRNRRFQLVLIIVVLLVFEAIVGWFFLIPLARAGRVIPASIAMTVELLGLLAAGICVWRLAFHPLDIARAAIEYFTHKRAEQRLFYPYADDDLGMTLGALNKLLDRQDEVLEHQRRFVGSISHDIRTPLTIMRGDIEIALARERTSAEYRDVLLSNLEEVERISKLIEDLLILARSDTGELGLRLRPVSLSNLLNEVRNAYLPQAEAQGIKLNLYIEQEVMIEGDVDRLRQLLDNLAENALHHTRSEGKVDFLLMQEEKAARLVVRDTGVGIPAKDLAHIFEPFYRGSQPMEHGHQGYGLGLAICQFIVQAHGGRIFVESQVGPGSGTTFTVLVPSILTKMG